MDKISLNENSTDEEINKVFLLSKGDVFHIVETDFYEVVNRIEELIPENKNFQHVPVLAGTSLYSMYGSGHEVVIINEDN